MELQDRLNDIFCEVFDDADIKISSEMTANDIDGWDSLSHINLITTIESKLNIRFTQKELLRQRNVGDMIIDIELKLNV